MSSIASIIRELRISRKELGKADFVLGVLLPVTIWSLIMPEAIISYLITIAGHAASAAA